MQFNTALLNQTDIEVKVANVITEANILTNF